eukprot:GILJ01001199.1.p1 GENE.GILJ01001199.1~~GILJ01001199.1.p1  ORF type:complete len:167 (-),score=8.24 GILJ01001199.1:711-1211(-)
MAETSEITPTLTVCDKRGWMFQLLICFCSFYGAIIVEQRSLAFDVQTKTLGGMVCEHVKSHFAVTASYDVMMNMLKKHSTERIGIARTADSRASAAVVCAPQTQMGRTGVSRANVKDESQETSAAQTSATITSCPSHVANEIVSVALVRVVYQRSNCYVLPHLQDH